LPGGAAVCRCRVPHGSGRCVRAGLLAPGSLPVSGLPKRPASTKRAAQWHTVETDSPVTAARPRRSYTGLPLTHTSWAQYSTEASVSLLAVISQKSAPVGKLKSWRVEELKSPWTRCDLFNFPTSSEVSAQQL